MSDQLFEAIHAANGEGKKMEKEPIPLEGKDFTTFSTGGTKEINGKPPLILVPYELVARCALRLEEGAKKYGETWKFGIPVSELTNATMRHMYKFANGYKDEDHLAAMIANLAMIAYFESNFVGNSEILDLNLYTEVK